MKRGLVTTALLLPLLLAGCGDDGDSGGDDDTSGAGGSSDGPAPDSDEAAIEETIVAFLLEPRCDLATDDYLVELAFADDATPEEGCEYWTSVFVEPVYDEDDILLTNVEIEGDVATLEVGSEYVNITTVYELTKVDGTWLVSGDEYNSDDL